MIIAISGNIGSGKSTLARYIAKKYGFYYVPSKRLEFDFIEDFFNDIEGKFFPAQVSFLLSKAIEIQTIGRNQNIVIDRSLIEDINVFAQLWMDHRNIDNRITHLYHQTADFIISSVPSPDLYIVCNCPAKICADRIKKRPPRKFETQYPPNHINMLEEYYTKLTYDWGVPYVEIDTLCYDFTDETILNYICESIFDGLRRNDQYEQLSLFHNMLDTGGSQETVVEGITFHNVEAIEYRGMFKRPSKSSKYIYLAAPFTQLATNTKGTKSKDVIDNDSFFDEAPLLYGELPQSYKKKLTRIEAAIKKQCDIPVLLPHRDINNWGKVNYPSEHILPKIIETVENATALVAIPGSSIGVHLEIGIAISKNIPIILIETDDFTSSFFVAGLSQMPYVKHLRAKSIAQVPDCIEKEDLLAFIHSSGGKK